LAQHYDSSPSLSQNQKFGNEPSIGMGVVPGYMDYGE